MTYRMLNFDIVQRYDAALMGLLACGNSTNDNPEKIARQALKQAQASAKVLQELDDTLVAEQVAKDDAARAAKAAAEAAKAEEAAAPPATE